MQNLKDRFHGANDPLAAKILSKIHSKSSSGPIDKTSTTLAVYDLHPSAQKEDIVFVFESFGSVDSVNLLGARNMAFVKFHDRQACEKAYAGLKDSLSIKVFPRDILSFCKGAKATLKWARNKTEEPKSDMRDESEDESRPAPPSLPPPEVLDNEDEQNALTMKLLASKPTAHAYPSGRADAVVIHDLNRVHGLGWCEEDESSKKACELLRSCIFWQCELNHLLSFVLIDISVEVELLSSSFLKSSSSSERMQSCTILAEISDQIISIDSGMR